MPRSKISEVFRAWREGREASAGHCWTDGAKIYTYGKPLLQRDPAAPNAAVHLNARTYSSTSSTHRNAIRTEANVPLAECPPMPAEVARA
jgi:hypothetical protein